MSLGPRLDLRPKVALGQSLVMTPQLQQAIKLLALSNLEIEGFIAEALEANPLLEIGESGDAPALPEADVPERTTSLETSGADQLIAEGAHESDAPLDLDPAALDIDRDPGDGFAHDLGMDGIRLSGGNGGDDADSGWGEQAAGALSLADHLHAQLGQVCGGETLFLARLLVDSLDEAGYLTIDLRSFADDFAVPLAAAETALAALQSLDPTGVGARSLAECLVLQAIEADRHDPCMARLLDNLDLLARGEIPRLRRMCGVDEEDFADMLAELRGYDPKPGLRYGGSAAPPVTPDLFVRRSGSGQNAGWAVTINSATLPRVLINRSYHAELLAGCAGSKAAKGWLGEKLADAGWLVKALDQRQQTILKVAGEIVTQQRGFFEAGVSRLKPLTLRQVAEAVELHESTVSRVTSAKYLQCERGVFELKYFFSSGVSVVAEDGGDGGGTSAQAVKAQIRALIDGEEPQAILSDETITQRLNEAGVAIARRTVVKYREAIGLGSSVQRRRAKAIAGVR